MVKYKLVYTKQAEKDAVKIKKSHLKSQVEALFDVLQKNPYQIPPRYEKLVGDLHGVYSRRINI